MRIFCLLLASALAAFGADWHVLEGGSGAGTSWSSPYGTLAAAQTAASRGDTIWIADGSYAGTTLNKAESGTTRIYIKKATESAHGSATGWSSTYGDGVADFTSTINIYSGYWTLDGVVGGGPTNWTGGHGFSSTFNASATYDTHFNFRSVTNIVISRWNIGPATQDDPGQDVALYFGGVYYGDTVTVEYSYIHHMGDQGASFDCQNLTFQYCKFDVVGGYELAGNHGNGIEIRHGNNFTFRYNYATRWEASGFLGLYGGATNAIANGWRIYGNIFDAGTGTEQGDVIYATGANLNRISDSVIYNNTFYAVTVGFIVDWDNTNNTGNLFKNNLTYSTPGTYSTVGMTFDYNASEDTLAADSHLQTLSGDPFTAAASGDFSLVSATTAGATLSNETIGSLLHTYDTDMNGVTRGSDGTWDRGAIEKDGAGYAPTIVTNNASGARVMGFRGLGMSVFPLPASSLLVDESFEETGTPAGWTASGTPDFDNTSSPIGDAQDLLFSAGSDRRAYTSFTESGEVWIRLRLKMSAAPASTPGIVFIQDAVSASEYVALQVHTSRTLRLADNGGPNTGYTTDAVPANTDVYVFIHIAKGTGANAVYELEWATTSTRTGGGTKYASASNGIYTVNSDYLDLFRNDSAWSTATWQIDDIKISNTGWPE